MAATALDEKLTHMIAEAADYSRPLEEFRARALERDLRHFAESGDFDIQAQAYLTLGAIFLRLGKYERALHELKLALQGAPSSAVVQHVAFTNQAAALINLGRFEEAVSACVRALKLNPTDAIVYGNLAKALDRLGLRDEALQVFRDGTAQDLQKEQGALKMANQAALLALDADALRLFYMHVYPENPIPSQLAMVNELSGTGKLSSDFGTDLSALATALRRQAATVREQHRQVTTDDDDDEYGRRSDEAMAGLAGYRAELFATVSDDEA